MRLALASLVLALAAAVATPAGASNGITSFRTPSKNIYCERQQAGRSDFLRCDVGKLAHPAPKPKGCQFDWGGAFGMTPRGRARALCVSDSVHDKHAATLAYGKTRRFGPFRCTSKRAGLRCSNKSGHGFFLNRTRYRLF